MSMSITGAVLVEAGRSRPYRQSRPIEVRTLDLKGPGPREILVRMEAAGVCHSDLSVVNGSRLRPLPMVLGHEAAGIVLEIGSGVRGMQVGDRVVMSFLPRCGRCPECATGGRLPCRRGSASNGAGEMLSGGHRLSAGDLPVGHHLGVSGFATHAVVDASSAVPVGPDVPPDVAAVLGCAVLTGGGAVLNATAPGDGDSVMIVGLGGVGMAALLVAVAHGVSRIVAVDNLDAKLLRARALGATETYTPAQLNDAIARGGDVKASRVVECAGSARAFETAVAATALGGTTVTVGLPDPKESALISPLAITAEARTIVGSYLGSALPHRDIPLYADMWRHGKLPIEELISARIRLEEINSAMDQLAEGEAIRQIILFD